MKTHLQANAASSIREPMAMCATQWDATKGKVRNNARATYVGMGSPIVQLQEFKLIPTIDRCSHCCTELLFRRNVQRARKGLAPVTTYDEGWNS